jgi:trk system potassium uptake protein TrkA
VAINKRAGMIIAPTADDSVEESDIMVVIGTNQQVDDFETALHR